ncbi:hypothetical protein CDD81_3554 [Ophiocordyceps australis]|uniref:Uncharacterized protein n=1 Tax=Ophiocordyceps australis TaxID=1399860 RepID=A0A2C5XVU6_9HYPO|nr:hypothetical protein CDD81_3554 [Ophiocordyceps australis]
MFLSASRPPGSKGRAAQCSRQPAASAPVQDETAAAPHKLEETNGSPLCNAAGLVPALVPVRSAIRHDLHHLAGWIGQWHTESCSSGTSKEASTVFLRQNARWHRRWRPPPNQRRRQSELVATDARAAGVSSVRDRLCVSQLRLSVLSQEEQRDAPSRVGKRCAPRLGRWPEATQRRSYAHHRARLWRTMWCKPVLFSRRPS